MLYDFLARHPQQRHQLHLHVGFGGFEGFGFEGEAGGVVLGGDFVSLGFEVFLDGLDLGLDAFDLGFGGVDVLHLFPGGGSLADGGRAAGDGAEAGFLAEDGTQNPAEDGDAGLHLGGTGFGLLLFELTLGRAELALEGGDLFRGGVAEFLDGGVPGLAGLVLEAGAEVAFGFADL